MLNAMSKNSENAEKINSLFELLAYVLRNDVKGWSLFFDEIFITLEAQTDLSEVLLKRLNDEAQAKLQEKFLADYDGSSSLSTTHEIECCYRYGLLTPAEQKDTDLGIKITPLLLVSQNRYITTMLCSIFRAISSLERKLTGALGEIDALLCCPILAHDIAYENKGKFSEIPIDLQMMILDSLFAILNWFRELVSVFCLDADPEVRSNVLVRFKQICDLQMTLDRLLSVAPDTFLPIMVNSTNSELINGELSTIKPLIKNQGSSKAAAFTTTQIDKPQNITISCTNIGKSKAKKDKKNSPLDKPSLISPTYRPFLRELSKDIFILLKHPLLVQSQSHDLKKIIGK